MILGALERRRPRTPPVDLKIAQQVVRAGDVEVFDEAIPVVVGDEADVFPGQGRSLWQMSPWCTASAAVYLRRIVSR